MSDATWNPVGEACIRTEGSGAEASVRAMSDRDERIEVIAKALKNYDKQMERYGGIAAASLHGIARTAIAALEAYEQEKNV